MSSKQRYQAQVVYIKDLPQNEPDILKNDISFHLKENKIEKRDRHFIIETYLSGFIEVSSFLDFFSDLYILVKLGQSTDTAWFSFMLFTMLCPYYTVYTSLITHTLNMIRQKR